ncbi:GCN5-related N-acetyltransferase [Coniophora puteana RWD-64-598 SS2]|uniref:GCN5-related N-acetyltransferase n=1 Tax=Coniophora puteana (strain RWD-64-598) TaxID=741705 RepID=A0A5M3MQT0_CONPW|nr:GCN5-related N-acetyltransferase [Coniophora puteana RWD-64-598 SS2]EIW81533.1 GCN5-related N-acetyltransferase [Coniophora puteana RWD-64-598 SS2]
MELRHSILWPDKPLEYVILPEDAVGHHFGAFLPSDDQLVAVISLFEEGVPAEVSPQPSITSTSESPRAVRFRKFACASSYQGRGIGTELLRHVCDFAKVRMGAKTIWCDARTSSLDWYQKRGLSPFGPRFYKGPVEYVRIRMDL